MALVWCVVMLTTAAQAQTVRAKDGAAARSLLWWRREDKCDVEDPKAALLTQLREDGKRFTKFLVHRYTVFGVLLFLGGLVIGSALSAFATHMLFFADLKDASSRRGKIQGRIERWHNFLKKHYILKVLILHPLTTLTCALFIIIVLTAVVVQKSVDDITTYSERVDYGLMNQAVMQFQQSFYREVWAVGENPDGRKHSMELDTINPLDANTTLRRLEGVFTVSGSKALSVWLGDEDRKIGSVVFPPRVNTTLPLGIRIRYTGAAGVGVGFFSNFLGSDMKLGMVMDVDGEALERQFMVHLEIKLPVEVDCLNLSGAYWEGTYDEKNVIKAAYVGLRTAHEYSGEHVLVQYDETTVEGSLLDPVWKTVAACSVALLFMFLFFGFVGYMLFRVLFKRARNACQRRRGRLLKKDAGKVSSEDAVPRGARQTPAPGPKTLGGAGATRSAPSAPPLVAPCSGAYPSSPGAFGPLAHQYGPQPAANQPHSWSDGNPMQGHTLAQQWCPIGQSPPQAVSTASMHATIPQPLQLGTAPASGVAQVGLSLQWAQGPGMPVSSQWGPGVGMGAPTLCGPSHSPGMPQHWGPAPQLCGGPCPVHPGHGAASGALEPQVHGFGPPPPRWGPGCPGYDSSDGRWAPIQVAGSPLATE